MVEGITFPSGLAVEYQILKLLDSHGLFVLYGNFKFTIAIAVFCKKNNEQ